MTLGPPFVAIAPSLRPDDDGEPLHYAAARMSVADSIVRAGGQPTVVVLREPATEAALQALARFDAIVFPGGGDSDPALYGQPDRHPRLRLVPPEQDASDLALARAALQIGLPTLGICRGMQLLNIVLGGSLVQHLEPTTVDHTRGSHSIQVTGGPECRVAAMMGAESFAGRSAHHQAVGVLGRGLAVTAVADDGCVEAFEHESAPIVGLQWHPELPSAAGDPQDGPFRWLVRAAQPANAEA